MARRCRPRIGVPSPTSSPAAPRRSADRLWRCDRCDAEMFSYHSCDNRSLPEVPHRADRGVARARRPRCCRCRYFHVTVTVPRELRALLRANQRDGYALLMKAAADAIIELARDPPLSSAAPSACSPCCTPGPSSSIYHPHVHCLVSGGGISDDGRDWHPARRSLPGPHQGLGQAGARQTPGRAAPTSVPTWSSPTPSGPSPGSSTSPPGGKGEQAVLDYLARYVFRIAITNARIVGLDDADRHHPLQEAQDRSRWRTCRIAGHEFMRRFLQHVLPRASTRSATSACGIPPSAKTPPAPVCCFFSTGRRRRLAAGSARTPPIHRPTRKRRTIRGSVPAAAKAF